MRKLFLPFVVLIALAVAAASAQETIRARIEAARAALTEIDAQLKSGGLSDADYLRLRAQNSATAGGLQAVILEAAPSLDAARKRAEELRPKSKDVGPGSESAAADYIEAKKLLEELDGELRSARGDLVRTDENAGRVALARRELFARQTFVRSSSVFSPFLWRDVALDAPRAVGSLASTVGDFFHAASARLTLGHIFGFLGVLFALAALTPPVAWVARRVLAASAPAPRLNRFRRALMALWTMIVLSALPLLALAIVAQAIDAFDISDPRLQPFQDAIFDGLRLVAVVNAASRGLLAPYDPGRRLIEVGARAAVGGFRAWVGLAVIAAMQRAIEPVADAVGSLALAVAGRAVAAVLAALVIAGLIRRLAAQPANAGATPQRDAPAPIRTLGWALAALLAGAATTGYVAFAHFLLTQALTDAALFAALYCLDAAVQSGGDLVVAADSTTGRRIASIFGLPAGALRQIVVLVQGITRLGLVLTAITAALGPWRIQSQDLFGDLRAAYFGFKLGGLTISLASILGACTVFLVALLVVRAIRQWMSARYLPHTQLDAGVRNSVATIFGYFGIVLALLLGALQFGFDFEKLALVAGALSVGIGFGLQTIVNNFLSGIILLWERGIRVGDWIVVGAEQGYVRRINARATEIETLDRATLIVPNALLVSGAVKNWVRADRIARILIEVHFALDSDPEAARAVLIGAAKANELVLAIPSPLVLFAEFGDWSLKFQLVCFVEDVEIAVKVKSDINFDVIRRMREAGLKQAVPYRLE